MLSHGSPPDLPNSNAEFLWLFLVGGLKDLGEHGISGDGMLCILCENFNTSQANACSSFGA